MWLCQNMACCHKDKKTQRRNHGDEKAHRKHEPLYSL